MTKTLLVEGYRPSGKVVSAERGYRGGYRSGGNEKPSPPPVPPKATSALAKPTKEN